MSMQCSVCGRPISKNVKKCICGYDREGWVLMELDKPDRGNTDIKNSPNITRATKKLTPKKTASE